MKEISPFIASFMLFCMISRIRDTETFVMVVLCSVTGAFGYWSPIDETEIQAFIAKRKRVIIVRGGNEFDRYNFMRTTPKVPLPQTLTAGPTLVSAIKQLYALILFPRAAPSYTDTPNIAPGAIVRLAGDYFEDLRGYKTLNDVNVQKVIQSNKTLTIGWVDNDPDQKLAPKFHNSIFETLASYNTRSAIAASVDLPAIEDLNEFGISIASASNMTRGNYSTGIMRWCVPDISALQKMYNHKISPESTVMEHAMAFQTKWSDIGIYDFIIPETSSSSPAKSILTSEKFDDGEPFVQVYKGEETPHDLGKIEADKSAKNFVGFGAEKYDKTYEDIQYNAFLENFLQFQSIKVPMAKNVCDYARVLCKKFLPKDQLSRSVLYVCSMMNFMQHRFDFVESWDNINDFTLDLLPALCTFERCKSLEQPGKYTDAAGFIASINTNSLDIVLAYLLRTLLSLIDGGQPMSSIVKHMNSVKFEITKKDLYRLTVLYPEIFAIHKQYFVLVNLPMNITNASKAKSVQELFKSDRPVREVPSNMGYIKREGSSEKNQEFVKAQTRSSSSYGVGNAAKEFMTNVRR